MHSRSEFHWPAAHHLAEDLIPVANRLIHRVRQRVPPHVVAVKLALRNKSNHLLGIFDRQKTKNELINEREDRRIRTNAQSNRENGCDRE